MEKQSSKMSLISQPYILSVCDENCAYAFIQAFMYSYIYTSFTVGDEVFS